MTSPTDAEAIRGAERAAALRTLRYLVRCLANLGVSADEVNAEVERAFCAHWGINLEGGE